MSHLYNLMLTFILGWPVIVGAVLWFVIIGALLWSTNLEFEERARRLKEPDQ